MASTTLTPVANPIFCNSFYNNWESKLLFIRPIHSIPFPINRNFNLFLSQSKPSSISLLLSSRFPISPDNRRLSLASTRNLSSVVQSYNERNDSGGNHPQKERGLKWPILRRWDVPWPWQTVGLTSLACGISFVVSGAIETQALHLFGIEIRNLTLDEKAELLLLDQGIATAVVLGVIFNFTKSSQPLPADIYRYDFKDPFNLQKGWLLWAGVGFIGAVGAIALTGAVMSFSGESPERETDALVRLLPLIGSSSVSTICLLGVTGVLAPLLEETVFRGFFMTSMTKWVPTPVAVLISAAVFAIAHLTPGEFPQLFVLGIALGLSYAQTRNLLTPIIIHSLWNSGVILLLTFLQLQGYDIKELLQSS